MCTYCGHISKRPVLEMPAAFSHVVGQGSTRVSHTGAYSGGHLVNGAGMLSFRGTARSDIGCWSRASERRGCTWFGESTCGGENCRAWQSFSRALSFLGIFSSFAGYIWRKVTGAGKLTAESSRNSQKLKDDLANSHESRGEKARKKANEKKQARLEKEQLEAEERKQREDVARMVEERRRLREEKLQIEQESEREAAAEREREIRRIREIERRRKDKAKERAGDQMEVRTAEQEMDAACTSINTSEEVDSRKTSFARTSEKSAESFKNARVSRGLRHEQGLRSKGATDNFVRSDSLKHPGTVKHGFFPASKMGSVFQNNGVFGNRTDGLHTSGKFSKLDSPISPGNMRLNPKSAGEAQSSDSAWKKVPWSNAWAKGSEMLKEDTSSMQTGLPNCSCERLDGNMKAGPNLFNNKAVGVKQSPTSVGISAIQPPIAPPSTHVASLHQLFSSPTIFPPLDLPVDFPNQREQIPQTEIKASFLPEHTFFETPACVTFQSCCSISGPSVPTSLPTPLSEQDSLPSLPQPILNPEDGKSAHTDISQHLPSVGSACLSENVITTEIKCNPVSPSSLSVSDSTTFDTANLSPTSASLKMDGSDFNTEKDDALIWDLPPFSLENADDFSEGAGQHTWTTLQRHDIKVHESLDWTQDEEPVDQEALQLPHLSTVQSLFDSEILLPESLSLSPRKEGNITLNGDEIACAAQVFDRKSLWSDISAFNAAVRIWDDADSHQKVPPEFVDCITQEIMQDPVITADGHSYERTAIEKWLKYHDTSPKTGEVLPPPPGGVGVDKTLRPNHILRGQIIEYKEKLAKMQPRVVSWSNMSNDDNFLTPGTLGVLSF